MAGKKEQVRKVLRGHEPDRYPVSFWHHFEPDQAAGQAAVDAHLRHIERFDLDFLKVMNDHPYPRGNVEVIGSVDDLRKVAPLAGDTEGFGGQLRVLRELRKRLGPDVLMCTTLFNAWATLRYFTQPPVAKHGPPKLDGGQDERDEIISNLLKQDRSAVQAAVHALGESLANFARECIRAGADGVFLSVRDDWVNRPANGPETYDEMVREADLAVLNAAGEGTFNWLHMCGKPQNFAALARYPVHVVNWADRAAGPSIAYARDRVRPTIAGGVDNLKTLPQGTPEQCANEVRDAIRQAGHRPILITPGCTYDPKAVPEANLRAMIAAARGQ